MCGAMTLTSCDELLGTEPDNPSNKVPDEMAETVKLLEQAQQEGALVAITFTYNSEQYQAVFKKVANEYVLQDPSAARTRARLVLPADDGLVVILTDNDIEKGILTFTATNAKTNECVLQAQISTPGLAITEHHRPTIRPLLTISASAVPSLTSTPLYQSAQQKIKKKMRPIT